MEDLKYWVAFNRIPSIGWAKFALMEQHFGDLEAAWHAPASELKEAGLDQRALQAIKTCRSSIDPDAELERPTSQSIKVVTWRDSSYPPLLREIYDLPPVLYVMGSILPEDERSVAVVGTCKATAYGREVAHRLSSDLAITTVSGTLTMLEVKGLVRQVGAMNYVRLKETVAEYEPVV